MRELIKHILTAKDGATFAPSRVYWLLAALAQIGLTIWGVVVQGHEFSSSDFGTGMGLILTAGATSVWMTKSTEPNQD